MDPVITVNGGVTIQTNDSASQAAPLLAAFFPPSPPQPPQAILPDSNAAGEPSAGAQLYASLKGAASTADMPKLDWPHTIRNAGACVNASRQPVVKGE